MKKKLVIMLTALMTAGMLAGCGSNNANQNVTGTETVSAGDAQTGSTESTENGDTNSSAVSDPIVLKDLKVEDYVTLGDYTGLKVNVSPLEVDQEEWDELVNRIYSSNITAESGGIMDRAVADGDTVNISYVGKRDDVAFDGGTANGALLTIGSGQYIEGFEAGLVGVNPGETVDLNLTFPENYGNSELAGADVVFSVTVNFIVPTEMEDEVVAAMAADEFKNVEELKQYVHDYLTAENQDQYNTNVENSILEAFLATCTFQENLPQDLIAEYKVNIENNVANSAASMGTDAETFVSYYYGTDYESFLNLYSQESAKQSLSFQAVANAEGLNINDEELDTLLQDYATQGGYSSVEAMMGTNPKEDYREYFMFEKVMDFLKENAEITEA